MIKFGTRRAGKGKKSRGHVKFPRGTKRMKNFEDIHLSMRVDKWVEVSIRAEHIYRFLVSNVGRPVNKVFSEFIKRCDKSIYNPKEIFYSYIERKEEINPRLGGFYVTNGILNCRKKRGFQRKEVTTYDLSLEFNKRTFPDNQTLRLACNKALRDGLTPIGKFYVFTGSRRGLELKNVFVRNPSSDVNFFKFRTVEVLGIGRYLYKHLQMDEKRGLYMHVELSRFLPNRTTSSNSVFEFVIKDI